MFSEGYLFIYLFHCALESEVVILAGGEHVQGPCTTCMVARPARLFPRLGWQ